MLLLWAPSARAAIVELSQISAPSGIVAQTSNLDTPVAVTTVTAPAVSGSYRFTHWTINGLRYDDDLGRSQNPVAFTLYEATVAIAHYLPATQDTDADTLPDWYETEYYSNLTQTAASDTDGDGYSLAEEYALGFHPRVYDEVVAGGLSRVRSSSVTMNLDLSPTYRLISSPPGFVSVSNTVVAGTVVATADLWGQANSGYRFAYWELDGVAQADTYGIAVGSFSFAVNSNTVATAHYFPAAQDADADGVADWFEYVYYGGLTQTGASDTDGDGFTLAQEFAQNTVPTLADEFVPGGISRARAAASTTMDLQPFERLEYTLVNGVLSNVFRAFNGTGGMPFGANAAPAFGDWDGDGDLDLFVGQAGGTVRVFENLGTRSAMNLSERTANFASLAATWSGIGSPAPALGDWSGDAGPT